MKKELKVNRIENKYLISLTERDILLEELEYILSVDKFGQDGIYRVKSLYFDTKDFRDYLDKVNHKEVRKTIRMRVYSGTDKSIKLEIKKKNHEKQKKYSMFLEESDAKEILLGNYEILKNYKNELAEEFFNIMKNEDYIPSAIIEYTRKAFSSENENIRITLDSDIKYSNTDYNIFDENLSLSTLSSIFENILEVKYKGELPSEVSEILNKLKIIGIPESKYKRVKFTFNM